MDRIDFAILRLLEEDARRSFGALAEQVGLSRTPCWNRVQSLERLGVIKAFRAVMNPAALDIDLNAFLHVRLDVEQHEAFEAAVQAHPAIVACYAIAGDGDYLLHVVGRDVDYLDRLLRKEISRLPGMQRLSTTVCLRTVKDDASLIAAADHSNKNAA